MTIEKIKGYEEPFKKNDKYGDYERAPFEFYKGDIPIIVTAPHTTKTINLKSGQEKANEIYTGALSLATREQTGCNLFIRYNMPKNITTPEEARKHLIEYYQKLKEYIVTNKIKYLIDIHGASIKRNFDIGVGISNGEFVFYEDIWKEIITSSFGRNKIVADFNTMFQASNGNTICRNIFELCQIRTTQLEINKKFRSPRDFPEEFMAMQNSLKETVEGISLQLKK